MQKTTVKKKQKNLSAKKKSRPLNNKFKIERVIVDSLQNIALMAWVTHPELMTHLVRVVRIVADGKSAELNKMFHTTPLFNKIATEISVKTLNRHLEREAKENEEISKAIKALKGSKKPGKKPGVSVIA